MISHTFRFQELTLQNSPPPGIAEELRTDRTLVRLPQNKDSDNEVLIFDNPFGERKRSLYSVRYDLLLNCLDIIGTILL